MMIRQFCTAFVLAILCVAPVSADLPNFTQLIEESSPAVVKINTVENTSLRRGQQLPPDMPDMFRDFFEQRRMPERKAYSMGSGFIISRDGYILTNNHVIDGASEINVRLLDRREFPGKVVGVDPRSDLALIKIDAQDLPTVKLAAADTLKVGEWVVAIGSPFGLDYSASVGIVSAIGRSIPTERGEDYVPFIQSDVAINPGNSGGPLFNLAGEVVGINSQIYTRSGGSIGLSFAIPSSVAHEVVAQLKTKGRVDRGWLGVYIQDVDRDLAKSLGLGKPQGALIAQVEKDGPAENAGIKAGDVVIEFNNQAVVDASDLPHIVGLMPPGSKATAVLIRKERKREVTVLVGKRPGEEEPPTFATSAAGDRIGLEVEPVADNLRQNWNITGGVTIRQVYPDTPAEGAGLQPGDVIVQLGYKVISDINDYHEVLAELPNKTPVAMRFFRRGRSIFRTIEIN